MVEKVREVGAKARNGDKRRESGVKCMEVVEKYTEVGRNVRGWEKMYMGGRKGAEVVEKGTGVAEEGTEVGGHVRKW